VRACAPRRVAQASACLRNSARRFALRANKWNGIAPLTRSRIAHLSRELIKLEKRRPLSQKAITAIKVTAELSECRAAFRLARFISYHLHPSFIWKRCHRLPDRGFACSFDDLTVGLTRRKIDSSVHPARHSRVHCRIVSLNAEGHRTRCSSLPPLSFSTKRKERVTSEGGGVSFQ